jgi:hypothetical protein
MPGYWKTIGTEEELRFKVDPAWQGAKFAKMQGPPNGSRKLIRLRAIIATPGEQRSSLKY